MSSKERSLGPTLLRVVVGLVFVRHGIQKLFSMGVPAVVAFLGSVGAPYPRFFGVVLPLIELFCGAALILGLLTRANALILAGDMFVAIVKVHWKNGFFMPMGYEFALTLLAANLSLMLMGGGAWSVDRLIWRGKEEVPKKTAPPPAKTAAPAATPTPAAKPEPPK